MRPILDAVVELHDCLDAAGIPHAFGGAFALLWCTGEPRTTVDIDLNIFAPPANARRILEALQNDSKQFGTQISIEGSVGVIRISSTAR